MAAEIAACDAATAAVCTRTTSATTASGVIARAAADSWTLWIVPS